MNKVVLDGISDNMSALIHNGKYGVINTADQTTMGYYIFKLLSEPYMFTRRIFLQAIHKGGWTYSKSVLSKYN